MDLVWRRLVAGVGAATILIVIAQFAGPAILSSDETDPNQLVAQGRFLVGSAWAAPNDDAEPPPENFADLLANANVASGEALARPCAVCHRFNRLGFRGLDVGPGLWEIVGRPFARVRSFAYSPAMARRQGSWGYEELWAFLGNSQAYFPGTSMRFRGIANARDRADVIVYLRGMSDDPLPLPSPPPLPEPSVVVGSNNGDGDPLSGISSDNIAAAVDLAAFGLGPVEPIEFDPMKAALGRRLFFDTRLSGNAAIACANCHNPEMGYSDGLALSQAYPGSLGFRNTPTLINTAHRTVWFHDGRLGTNLNDVTRESLTETYVMNMDMRLMQERLKQDPVYVRMFAEAGYGEPSNGAVRNAIPEYLKTLTSRNAPFPDALSPAAQRGLVLFTGRAGCVSCHYGTRFTDDAPHNVGVPENPEIWSDPLRHITFVTFAKFMGIENYMNVRRDVGAHIRSHRADGSDIGSFITPTLRELIYTAPYMHNGIFATLADVVAFYNDGGGTDPNSDPDLGPLGLTDEEQRDLVVFLESLSGAPLTGPDFVWPDIIPATYPAIDNWLKMEN